MTYYLRKDEVMDPANPGRNLSIENLTRIYALNPSSGELTDMTAFVTLVSRTETGGNVDFETKACLEFPDRNPNGLTEAIPCTSEQNFQALIAGGAWDYVRLIGQPRIFQPAPMPIAAGPPPPPPAAAAAGPGEDPDLGYQQLAYLPMFESNTSNLALELPQRTETLTPNLTLGGTVQAGSPPADGFEAYHIEYGYGPKDQISTFQDLLDAGLAKTAVVREDGSFDLALLDLQPGRTALLAKIIRAGADGQGLASSYRSEIIYHAGSIQIGLVQERLLSNLENREVQFQISSPVSGTLSIDIFDESGNSIAGLSAVAQADARTMVAWNPSNLAGIEARRNLLFTVTLAPNHSIGTSSASGSIAIDYTLPEIAIRVVESRREGVLIEGACLDGLNRKPLTVCQLALETTDGQVFHEAATAIDLNGEFSITVPGSDMGEAIPNHAFFRVRLSGVQASGNSASVSKDARFDFLEEPVISPFDLSAESGQLNTRVDFPAGATGETFHQGNPTPPGAITEEGLHLISAGTRTPEGISATAAHNVLLDRTAPAISLHGLPADGAVVQSPVQIQALVEDDHLVSGTLSISSETGPVTLRMQQQGDALFYSAFDYGTYTVRVSGSDMAGNRASRETRFTYDQGVSVITAEFGDNDFVPVANGQVELRWNVLEDHPEWIRKADVTLGGQGQPVVYTEVTGRSGSLTGILTRIPVDAAFEGSGTVVFTVEVPGEAPVSLTRGFRVNQTGPVLVSLDPEDNARVPRQFSLRAVISSPVGLEHVEAAFADGTIISSASLSGETAYTLAGNIDYQGAPLQINLLLTALDRLGQTLRREVRYSVFDFQVLMKDNAISDNRVAKPQIKLINLSQQPLTGFTVRLWLSRQELPGLELAVDKYFLDPCGIMVKVGSHPSNANLMMVDFAYPAGYVIPAGGETPEAGLQIGLHFKSRSAGPQDKANDWSWQGITGNFKVTRNVTLHDASGNLLYGQEPDASTVPQPPAGPPAAEDVRVSSSLQALYAFHEGFGTVATDISAVGIPLDLALSGSNAKWLSAGGLDLTVGNHNAILENRTPNRKLFASSILSGQVSVEAWIEPSNTTQNTARIVEYADAGGAFSWNWSLVQNQKNLEFRLRTSTANPVYLTSTSNPIPTPGIRYHVLLTYEPFDASSGKGGIRMYVNGNLAAFNQEAGALRGSGTNAWDPAYIVTVGNHAGALDRDWQGKIHLVAVHSRALTVLEVARNFNAGVVEPAIPEELRLGVVCGDRLLPFDILDGAREWREDKTADGRAIAMGGSAYTAGLGGQPQSTGAPAWMVYDLAAEKDRLGLSGQSLRLTGFGGKQDGSATTSIFIKTSPNAAKPGDNDWLNGTGGVIQRFHSSNGANLPMSVDLKYSKWLMVGTNSTQAGSNLHGVFGDARVLYGPVPPPVFAPKLVYRYFQIDQTACLPNFDALTPMKTGLVDRFDLSPKARNDDFAMEFVGFVNITAAGTYTFFTSSDDGSRLFVDGRLIVDNDGLHGVQERSGQIALVAGYHAIKVQYFERGGGEVLDVKYQGPGIGKTAIPAEVLSHSETFGYGVEAKYYEGTWNNLPSFEALPAVSTDFRNGYRIVPRALQDGFGFAFDGNIFIPAASDYTFYLNSDDGSQLFVDEKRVVDNDGGHAMQERSGTINLSPGFHSIRVTYFERSGSEGLEVKFHGPGISKTAIPVELLFGPYPQRADLNQGGKAGAITMGGENADRNYSISGSQWFKIPLSSYANTWARTIVVALDDMDGRLMVGTYRFENQSTQAIDGWFKSYSTSYTGQSEAYFTIDVPEKRTYKVRWWFQ
ncbi:MAG: PA14 domain-containing protein [Fibrobacterota bacterium]|nr:PA14 domain-containing protein [Fibrobacterota bacterium]